MTVFVTRCAPRVFLFFHVCLAYYEKRHTTTARAVNSSPTLVVKKCTRYCSTKKRKGTYPPTVLVGIPNSDEEAWYDWGCKLAILAKLFLTDWGSSTKGLLNTVRVPFVNCLTSLESHFWTAQNCWSPICVWRCFPLYLGKLGSPSG